jgi:hypothetical protein
VIIFSGCLYASTSEYTSDSSTSTRDFKFLTINLSFSLSIKKWEVSLPFYHIKSVSQSLSVGVSTVCELTMYFSWFDVRNFGNDTTVCGMANLSVVQSRCFFDLLANEVECVHLIVLNEWKVNLLTFRWIRFPVPSVVCVPEGMNDPFRDLLASHVG